jgi:hypothetical protein
VKREIYINHAACEVVLVIEQDRMEVRVGSMTEGAWHSRTLGPSDELVLPSFGLRCTVRALYEGTPLAPPNH